MTAKLLADKEVLGDREVAEWLFYTLRMFGADEANAYRIVALFLDAINQESHDETL